MYVSMYSCMYVCMYGCMYVYIYMYMYKYMHASFFVSKLLRIIYEDDKVLPNTIGANIAIHAVAHLHSLPLMEKR